MADIYITLHIAQNESNKQSNIKDNTCANNNYNYNNNSNHHITSNNNTARIQGLLKIIAIIIMEIVPYL